MASPSLSGRSPRIGPGPRIFPDAALVPARSRSKDTIPAARFTTRTYALSCWSSALRFPRAFCRGTRKCQPCHKRREFFVLAPGRTKHPPQFGQTAFCLLLSHAKVGCAAREKLALLHSQDRKSMVCARTHERVAEHFALGRVDQCMRGEHRFELRQQPRRASHQTACSHPITLLPQLVNGHFDSVARQPLAGVQTLLDPSLRFLQVETFGEVIGLHRTSCGTIGQVDFSALDDVERTHRSGDGNEARPS